jgi:surface antigen Omp85-like protein
MRRALGVACSLLLVALAAPAAANELTGLERQTVSECAERLGLPPDLDPAPDGKVIEGVDVVVLDVFDGHDPIPDWFNVFHTMSRQSVIRRELLFQAGERYKASRADETARNLRTLRQLSLVLVVALPGSAPGRVRVLVVVRDVWSLRLNTSFSVSSHGLKSFLLEPSEENLAGLHLSLGALFYLDPGAYSLGGVVHQRRILGTDLEGQFSANVIYGRVSGKPEGSFGFFSYGEPLRHANQKWSYGIGGYWRSEISRRFGNNGALELYDDPATQEAEAIPVAYHSERYVAGYELIRSFGRVEKFDVSLGFQGDRRAYRHTPLAGVSPRAELDFQREYLPVSDTRFGPFAQLRTHRERYLRTSEVETLGLEEDYRLGPEALLVAYPSSSLLGSTRNFMGLIAGASMTLGVGDGIARAVLLNRVEYADDGRNDADAVAQARLTTPRLGFGRLTFDALWHDRYENYLNRQFDLGGDTRLRGYPPAGFQYSRRGPLVVALNAEFRTRSIDILSAQTGLAAFYDAGDATDDYADIHFRQSAGIGIRILFPQADRVVLRGDWAFPFTPAPGYSTFPGAFYVTFDQAFSMPGLPTPTVTDPDLR